MVSIDVADRLSPDAGHTAGLRRRPVAINFDNRKTSVGDNNLAVLSASDARNRCQNSKAGGCREQAAERHRFFPRMSVEFTLFTSHLARCRGFDEG